MKISVAGQSGLCQVFWQRCLYLFNHCLYFQANNALVGQVIQMGQEQEATVSL